MTAAADRSMCGHPKMACTGVHRCRVGGAIAFDGTAGALLHGHFVQLC